MEKYCDEYGSEEGSMKERKERTLDWDLDDLRFSPRL